MIYIEPIGGLCNRMRSVLSAYKYAVDNSMDMTVLWWCHDECNCRFEDIFDLSAMKEKSEIGINVINMPFVGNGYLFRKIRHYIKNRTVCKIKNKCELVINDADRESIKDKNADNIYISSYNEWYDTKGQYEFFILCKELRKRAEQIRSEYTDYMVGIHIRRTDNSVSIEHSSTEMFIKVMKSIIDKNENAGFYLATDDLSIRDIMYKQFGNRIICKKEIVMKRDSLKGIEDAIIDLLNLSFCKMIIGSYYSSFSEVAALIGKIRLEIVKDDCVNVSDYISNYTGV